MTEKHILWSHIKLKPTRQLCTAIYANNKMPLTLTDTSRDSKMVRHSKLLGRQTYCLFGQLESTRAKCPQRQLTTQPTHPPNLPSNSASLTYGKPCMTLDMTLDTKWLLRSNRHSGEFQPLTFQRQCSPRFTWQQAARKEWWWWRFWRWGSPIMWSKLSRGWSWLLSPPACYSSCRYKLNMRNINLSMCGHGAF